jgi:hypothetical protein
MIKLLDMSPDGKSKYLKDFIDGLSDEEFRQYLGDSGFKIVETGKRGELIADNRAETKSNKVIVDKVAGMKKSTKLYFNNNSDFIIEFCSGLREYEVAPGDSVEVDVADEDVVYIDAVY